MIFRSEYISNCYFQMLVSVYINHGFVIAGLTLAFVVVLLAIFVLVPDRRRSALDTDAALGFSAGALDRD